MVILYVSTFALISPIGVGIGIAISETVPDEASLQGSLVTILQALATGTLLYVVFFEVIERERLKGTKGLTQVSVLFLYHHFTKIEHYFTSAQFQFKVIDGK